MNTITLESASFARKLNTSRWLIILGITNAKAAGTLRRNSVRLDRRTVGDLRDEAKRIGIAGRSKMKKAELIDAIRNHG